MSITTTDPSHDDIISVLENSLYPGAKRESIKLVLAYCRANGLDPMLRPVHIVPTSIKLPNGNYETRDVLMPGIADYRIKAARSGEYGGKSEPEFGPDVRETLSGVAVTYPAWCRVTVRRIVQGHAREFVAMERWVENYATAKRDTTAPNAMWKKRPYGQLAKVAEAQALRMAFPEFSPGYTMEEMQGKTLHDDWAGPTIEAEAPSPAPLRAAATPTPRAPRVADTAVYEPPRRTVGDLLTATALALADARTREEVDVILRGDTMQKLEAHATGTARERLDEIKASVEARFAAAPTTADDDGWPGGDLEIVGADKLAAG